MKWKTKFIKGLVSIVVPKEVVDLGAKIGNDMYEQQKSLIRVPDLKDVHIDEALRILKEELHLIPTKVIANPNIAYADESEYKVVLAKPRFGSRVNPGTTIKVYYLTQEIIDKSKVLLGSVIHVFKVPNIIGFNIYDVREDLESLGLKVTERKEQPSLSFTKKVDGQVTRLTYSNGKKTGNKLKTGDRVWIYYVDDEVITKSIVLRYNKNKSNQEKIEKIEKVTKSVTKGISSGAVSVTKNLTQNIGNRLSKKKINIEEELSDE